MLSPQSKIPLGDLSKLFCFSGAERISSMGRENVKERPALQLVSFEHRSKVYGTFVLLSGLLVSKAVDEYPFPCQMGSPISRLRSSMTQHISS